MNDAEILREQVLELAYQIAKATHLIRFAPLCGLTLRPWIIQRERRDIWQSLTPESRERLSDLSHKMGRERLLTVTEAEQALRRALSIRRK